MNLARRVDTDLRMNIRTAARRLAAGVVTGVLVVTTFGLTTVPAQADTVGGTGGAPGGSGTRGSDGLSVETLFSDNFDENGMFSQGYDQDSIDFFVGHGNLGGTHMGGLAQNICRDALEEADDRNGTDGDSRVVALMWTYHDESAWGSSAARWSKYFYDALDEWVAGGYSGVSEAAGTRPYVVSYAQQAIFNVHGEEQGAPYVDGQHIQMVCVALANNEGLDPATYDLSVCTHHGGNTFARAGASNAVHNRMAFNRHGSSISENVTADVTLHWDGSAGNLGSASHTESLSVANSGSVAGPEFTPGDFGWTTWAAGTYRYEVRVAKQGNMGGAVTSSRTCGVTPRQWTAITDVTVTTTAQNDFDHAGGNQAVFDQITTSNGNSPLAENVTADVILHWDGIGTHAARSSAKSVELPTAGTTSSPNFLPSDINSSWTRWAPGRYWFDVQIDQQGTMSGPIDTPNFGQPGFESSETWYATTNLEITTDATGTFTLAGSGAVVSDTIHANSNGSPLTESYNGSVVLHWDGVDSNATSVTKPRTIASNGDTASPQFRPIDFGWGAWPSGQFWFDIIIPRQGTMASAINTPNRVPSETWQATIPAPVKALTVSGTTHELDSDQVLAAGMTYDARISAVAAGHNTMRITDTIHTEDVWIGGTEGDVGSEVYVLDPDGNVVSGATVAINRATAGEVAISAQFSVPDRFQGLTYTLVVPTYAVATGSNYTIADTGEVCYFDATTTCLTSNDEQIYKVTPVADKVWVLDEDGALTTEDAGWTNEAGQADMVFLPGDKVSAVVNGSISGQLADNLDNYQLIDDWSNAADYVDFADASLVKVYYESASGSNTYMDVTDQFEISIENSITTATAKAVFLNNTADLPGDRKTKLIISGAFRGDYDTDGAVVELTNSGSEVWNNETAPTNDPSVFTWTPDPNKEALGSSEEVGDHTYDNIESQYVLPGQEVEYSIGVDVNIPDNLARGVHSLAVVDTYDPQLIPDKTSVEFWDTRNPVNPKPIASANYSVTWEDATNSFTVTFNEDWVSDTVRSDNRGWLTMRFVGTVADDTPLGSVLVNTAYELINDMSTSTGSPEVEIPTYDPVKTVTDTDGGDIDGATVVTHDEIVYSVMLDASIGADEYAYYVHRLGIVDDFDEEYLDVQLSDIAVIDTATDEDVSDRFNIQINEGVLYVFAKTVDTVNPYGQALPGDPQPTDLAAYTATEVDTLSEPAIDQTLLGTTYAVVVEASVSQAGDDHVIANQGLQHIDNVVIETEIVTNPVVEIDPDKDIVSSRESADTSLDETEIRLGTTINYQVTGSLAPAGRAYDVSTWSVYDALDTETDLYEGVWAVYTETDLYDGSELIASAGEPIADSEGAGVGEYEALVDVVFDEEAGIFTLDATAEYLTLVNSRSDLEQQYSAYIEVTRMFTGEEINNQAVATYNGIERDTNTVWSWTVSYPSVDVDVFSFDEGPADGSHETIDDAHQVSKELIEAMEEYANSPKPDPEDPEEEDTDSGDSDEGSDGEGDGEPGDSEGPDEGTEPDDVDSVDPGGDNPDQTPDPDGDEGDDEADGEEPTDSTDPGDATAGDSASGTGFSRLFSGQPLAVTAGFALPAAVDAGDEEPTDPVVESDEAAPGVEDDESTSDESDVDKDGTGGEDPFGEPRPVTGVDVGFTVTNTGDVPLASVTLLSDTVMGMRSNIEDVYCAVPDPLGGHMLAGVDALTFKLEVGESFDCLGVLRGMSRGEMHNTEGIAVGASWFTGEIVTDRDPWFAQGEALPVTEEPEPTPEPDPVPEPVIEPEPTPVPEPQNPAGSQTGIASMAGVNPWLMTGGLSALALAGFIGLMWHRRRGLPDQIGGDQWQLSGWA